MKQRSNHFAVQSPAGAAVALFSLSLERRARETLGRQLYLQIRERVLSGRLTPGTRLPSTRKLAEELGISRTVPLTAYDQLAAEGFVESRRGSGQYVRSLGESGTRGASRKRSLSQRKPVRPALSSVAVPFDSGSYNSARFPHSTWAKLLARGWRREACVAAGDTPWGGLPALRNAIARYLFGLRGIVCDAEQIVVTAGTTDALQLIVRVLATKRGPQSKRVWVEDPGYDAARRALVRERWHVVPVPVDDEGLDVDAGHALAPNARLAIVTSSRQYPLGVPLSLPRRLALLAWAQHAGALIAEDEYDSEIRFTGRPMSSLMSLDRAETVLTIGSFSKLMFPGLRLGYIVAPPMLARRIVAARALEGIPVSLSAQPALAEFIDGGHLARHLRALRLELTQRRGTLLAALREKLDGEITIPPQEVGINLTVKLGAEVAARMTDADLGRRALAAGLVLHPLSAQATSSRAHQGFLLGYAGCSDASIRDGVARLAGIFAGARRRRGGSRW